MDDSPRDVDGRLLTVGQVVEVLDLPADPEWSSSEMPSHVGQQLEIVGFMPGHPDGSAVLLRIDELTRLLIWPAWTRLRSVHGLKQLVQRYARER